MRQPDSEENTWLQLSDPDKSYRLPMLILCRNAKDYKSQCRKSSRFKIEARMISDTILGLSDSLTVPFAFTAGLSVLGSTKVVIYSSLAELIAGAISIGLGGYLGAKSKESV